MSLKDTLVVGGGVAGATALGALLAATVIGSQGRKQINREVHDPRLYSNMRNMFHSAEDRVKAHKNLDRRKDHTVASAMREGFSNKISAIEPAVFKSFAEKILCEGGTESRREEPRTSVRTVGLERTNYGDEPGRSALAGVGSRARD